VETQQSRTPIAVPEVRPAPLAPADPRVADILETARERGTTSSLRYAGEVTPDEAWELFEAGAAAIVDVRTAEELAFVGRVPDTVHVAWATGLSMNRNPRFTRELESKVGKDAIVLFLCRSAKRSAVAAEVATQAGFAHAYNILEGFEGDLDAQRRRGVLAGWRLRGLQDAAPRCRRAAWSTQAQAGQPRPPHTAPAPQATRCATA